jgi:uncharacterized protein YkwD
MSDIDYEKLEEDLFKLHNQVRTNPQSFIPKLKSVLTCFKNKIYHIPGEEPIQTFEGSQAVKEAIQFLKTQKPVQELKFSYQLQKACKDHVDDIGPKGITTHEGSDGKNLSDRIERYAEWDGATAENLEFGLKNAENIMLNLIINDGVQERYQRSNLFHPELKFVGISCGPHKIYNICTVIGYARGIRDFDTEPEDVSEFIAEYIKNSSAQKDYKNDFQEDEPYAPDNTVSLKIIKKNKNIGGKMKKITQKIFTLDNGAQHIVEIEEN